MINLLLMNYVLPLQERCQCVGTCQHISKRCIAATVLQSLSRFHYWSCCARVFLFTSMYMMVRANPTHSTKSLTFWTGLCLILCMRVMRGYYGGKGGGGGGVAMPSQYCCVFASLLLLRHARTMPWCHFIFGLWYFRIFSMLVWSFCFLLSTGFGGRQQDRPPTSKGWTKGGGGW